MPDLIRQTAVGATRSAEALQLVGMNLLCPEHNVAHFLGAQGVERLVYTLLAEREQRMIHTLLMSSDEQAAPETGCLLELLAPPRYDEAVEVAIARRAANHG